MVSWKGEFLCLKLWYRCEILPRRGRVVVFPWKKYRSLHKSLKSVSLYWHIYIHICYKYIIPVYSFFYSCVKIKRIFFQVSKVCLKKSNIWVKFDRVIIFGRSTWTVIGEETTLLSTTKVVETCPSQMTCTIYIRYRWLRFHVIVHYPPPFVYVTVSCAHRCYCRIFS